MSTPVRIDKWLWAARFYKTRSMANSAVVGGKVHVNTKRIKSSYRVKLDDVIVLTKAQFKIEVVVLKLMDQRRSAKEAQELYCERENSVAQRELSAAQRKILNQSMPRSIKKPNKHERQKIRALLGKSK
ncbi:MAG: S4 domain-containing protein [Gammaproteobacteria bacterium]|nr:S4 domain-containing protein [Gammaproteobacteria bacterium]